ncbi:Kae1-like domain-containing protein [Lentzea sp. NPDC004789]
MITTERIEVHGAVQGVGFRPHVLRLGVRAALGPHTGDQDFGAPSIPDTRPTPETALVRRMIELQANSPLASRAGRLFDAAAALLGVCDENSYEGEAAVLLEAAAAGHRGPSFDWTLHRRDGMWVYDPVPTLRDLVTCGDSTGVAAARFHTTIAEVTAALVREAAGGVRTVCLGGGVFQNRRLVDAVTRELGEFQVLVGERVPVNDGGISYGQAAVAAALLAAMRALPEGAEATNIGEVTHGAPGRVLAHTLAGSSRVADVLVGEQLPRIC